MGTTAHEVSGVREARNHPTGRAVLSAGTPHPGAAGRATGAVLQLVCAVLGRRPRSSGRPSRPDRVWNRIPDAQRIAIIDLALAEPDLSPRELAVRFTERERYFVSEASVYRLLKTHDLITSPAFIVVSAAAEFHTKTTAPN